jgi:hypothetical protein
VGALPHRCGLVSSSGWVVRPRVTPDRASAQQRHVWEALTTDATLRTRVAHREPHGQVSWTIHPRTGGVTRATTPACTGAPARCRETPAHVAHVSREMNTEDRGRQRCGRNHDLLPPLLLFPHREGRWAIPHGTGSSTHKKTPTWNGRGRHLHAAAPFPRKDVSALCREGLLARGMSLLSAPSQGDFPQWSLQISFRSQLRGSDGFTPSSLVTISDCDQPYQRRMQFCVLAYGRAISFVKDISV